MTNVDKQQRAQDLGMPAEMEQTTQQRRQDWRFVGPTVRILYLCTNNSARSQMAEALTRYLTHGQVEVFSAGSHPAAHVHPEAVRAIARLGADMSQHVPKSLDQFRGQSFDRVIVLCARDEEGPSFPSPSKVVTWDFPDPVARTSGNAEEDARLFQGLAAELTMRIRLVLTLIERERREQE